MPWTRQNLAIAAFLLAHALPAWAVSENDGSPVTTPKATLQTPDFQTADFPGDPLLALLASPPDADFPTRLAQAVARHPATGEAEANARIADAQRRQARAALFPTLSLSLSATRSLARDFQGFNAILEGIIPAGRADAQAAIDQPLLDLGTQSRVAGASARSRAARADADNSLVATALEALTAAHEVVALHGLVEIAEARAARHRQILADTITRAEAGLAARADIPRIEAGLAQAEAQALMQGRALAAARARYAMVFGTPAPARPGRPARPQSRARSVDDAITLSHATPPVIAALAAAEAARADARATARDALPRLSGTLAANRYDAFNPGPNYDIRGTLVLRQSFSAGGLEAARTAEARARAQAAVHLADRIAAEAAREAETAYEQARLLENSRRSLEAGYRASRKARDSMAEQVRLQRAALIELLRAEDDHAAAASALLQTSLEADLACFVLLARTGELAGHFGLAVPRY
jgi:adhesin transport system outer membrane protein